MVADPGSDEIIGSLGGGHHQCQHLLLTTVETEAQKVDGLENSHIYHFAKLELASGVLTSMPIHSFLKCSNQSLNVLFSVAKSCLTIHDPHGLQYTRLHSPTISQSLLRFRFVDDAI